MNEYDLHRFVDAQLSEYAIALSEIKRGRKRSHWMWYVFPQIQGLGFSSTSRYYSITNLDEAAAYLQHPVLGSRLIEICNALLALETSDAYEVFGSPDDMKLRSSMTLFSEVPGTDEIFQSVLQKFFQGIKDSKTLNIIKTR